MPNQHRLHFTVRDTGIGIPPDRLGMLFQAFTQVDASTSRKYGGTGLGLAISRRLSEMMGGTMWVESAGVPGQGSAFHFTIRADAAPEIRVRPHLAGEQAVLRGRRVLIVDDNATNRRILRLQTGSWGMLPRETASPHEALEWIAREIRSTWRSWTCTCRRWTAWSWRRRSGRSPRDEAPSAAVFVAGRIRDRQGRGLFQPRC